MQQPSPTDGWIASAVIAAICLLVAFSSPVYLLFAAVAGAYAFHLRRGGRDITGSRADGTPRARAWLVWAFIAVLAALTFSPIGMLIGAGMGGYAAYLFNGGRDVTRTRPDGSRRSLAWIYWGAIALLAFWCAVADPLAPLYIKHWVAWIACVGSAVYAAYLFRGGRFVFWFGG